MKFKGWVKIRLKYVFLSLVHSCVNFKSKKEGEDLIVHPNVDNWEKCAEHCHQNEGCQTWTWVSDSHAEAALHCYLFGEGASSTDIDDHVSGTKASWNCLQTTAHNFAGVDVQDDLKLTGHLGGYEMSEFNDVLYKSKANVFTGSKTFSDVTVDEDIVTAGSVNNLADLSSDLLFLVGTKTAVGDFTFAEVEMNGLEVAGQVDGVTWASLMSDRLLRDQDQTITATYTFGFPTAKIHFQGDILGNGDEDNAELNGQKISSLRTAEEAWSAVGAVKVAAQVEANVLCQYVKNLNKAYLSNLNVDFFEELNDALIDPADDFQNILQMDTIRLGDEVYLVVLSASKILTAKVTDGSLEDLAIHEINNGPNVITSACALQMANNEIRDDHDVSFFILFPEGLQGFNIDTASETSVETANYNLHFGSEPFSMGCIDRIQTCFVALQDQSQDGKYRMRIVKMRLPVDSTDVWIGEDYSLKMDSPDVDVIMIKEKLYFAISDQKNHADMDYLTLIEVDVTYPSEVKFSVKTTTTIAITEHNFVLIAPRQEPLIVAAKQQEVIISIS